MTKEKTDMRDMFKNCKISKLPPLDERKMTDNNIIKALECCRRSAGKCPDHCPLRNDDECINTLSSNVFDLINRQKEEIKRLEYTLLGVMHSVDKWLDGDELKQDEVNRAATMREKTLGEHK